MSYLLFLVSFVHCIVVLFLHQNGIHDLFRSSTMNRMSTTPPPIPAPIASVITGSMPLGVGPVVGDVVVVAVIVSSRTVRINVAEQ